MNFSSVKAYSLADGNVTAGTTAGITEGATVFIDKIIANSFGGNTRVGVGISGYEANTVSGGAFLLVAGKTFTAEKITATAIDINAGSALTAKTLSSYSYVSASAGTINAESITAATNLTVSSGTISANDINICTNRSINSGISITDGGTIEVNNSLTVYGTPCTYRTMTGTSEKQGYLKFNYCNPEVAFVDIQYITAITLAAEECGGDEQTFTVYGNNLGGNENVTVKTPVYTGTNNWGKLLISCAPTVVDFAKAPGVNYQWHTEINGEKVAISAENGGKERYFVVEESGTYILDVDYAETLGTCWSTIRQTISIDANRTWTALGEESNWEDPENWEPKSVPDICSYVIIPGGLRHYPVLKPAGESGYEGSKCYTIDFRFGGEVKNTHLLTYTSAKVEMTVNSNQWHMLSAPLKNIYSGDFYVSDSNPYEDQATDHEHVGLLVRTQKFNVENHQTGEKTVEYDWTGAFNTNDVELKSGEGIALFANPRYTDWDTDIDVTFAFPKKDPFHYYYRTGSGAIIGQGADLDRSYNGRFIYETSENEAPEGYLVTLNASPGNTVGDPVLVGNPFMAHLDFLAFAARNSEQIEKEYRLAYDRSTTNGAIKEFVTYSWKTGTLVRTPDDSGVNPNPELIAPMQSFILTAQTASPTIVAHSGEDTQTKPGQTLRSARTGNGNLPVLRIKATMDGYQNSTVVTITPDASMDYHSSEDSYKLFYSEATDNLSIYTLSSDLYALEINAIGESDGLIPVGFRTAKKGTISLSFSNTDGFEDFYLYDSLLDKDILVREGASYSFENTSDELYNDNRLYLKSLRSATGLSNITSNRIVVYPENRKIAVKALFEEEIREVYVYNSQGQVLSGETDIHSNSHSVSIAAEGVYIVVVQGKDSVLTRKVTIW